jgi:tetratricopeptide (TPR) repeat protein
MMVKFRGFIVCIWILVVCSPAFANDGKYIKYNRLLTIENDSVRCTALLNYADMLTDSLHDYDFALLIYQKVNTLLMRNSYPNLQLDLYYKLGLLYYRKGNYSEADKLYVKTLGLKNLEQDLVLKAKVLNMAGANLQDLGAYKRALGYLNESLAIYIKLDNDEGKSTVYQNMANIFALSGNLASSDKYFDKASEIFLKLNLKENYATVIGNKAYIKWQLGYPDSAKALLLNVLKINLPKMKLPGHTVERHFNLAFIYAELSRWDSCFIYLHKGKAIADSLGLKSEYDGSYYYNTAYCYNLKGDYNRAITYFKRALQIKSGIANYSMLYDNIAIAYAKNKQFDSAFVYKTFAAELADSIYKSELKEHVAFENKRVELLEKDYANEIQSSFQKQSLNELKNRNYLLFIIISLLLAVLLILFLYFIQYRVKIKKEHLQSELDFLKAQLNPHFLFNSINNIYVLLDENKDKASDVLLKFSALMRYQLYECNVPLIQLRREFRFLENYTEFEKLRYAEKVLVEYHFDYSKAEQFRIAPLLLQPFIENAFKHCPKNKHTKSTIHISTTISHNILTFEVTNTFVASSVSSLPGGIGLKNVKKRLGLLYFGKYKLTTGIKGDLFNITLKLTLAND